MNAENPQGPWNVPGLCIQWCWSDWSKKCLPFPQSFMADKGEMKLFLIYTCEAQVLDWCFCVLGTGRAIQTQRAGFNPAETVSLWVWLGPGVLRCSQAPRWSPTAGPPFSKYVPWQHPQLKGWGPGTPVSQALRLGLNCTSSLQSADCRTWPSDGVSQFL